MDPASFACKLPNLQPKWGGFLLLIFLFSFIAFSISTVSDFKEIRENWPKYRCKPQIMPFAGLYGASVGDNFNYCMQNMFTGFGGDFVKPFYGILGSFTKILSTLLGSINSLRVMMASLIGGITKIFSEFSERLSLFFFRIKATVTRMKMLMQRVVGIMFSVLYMSLSGMLAALNFGDTVLFAFLDTFCFAPETLITLSNGNQLAIKDVKIGDILKGGHRVTGVFKFHADGQSMRILDSGSKNPIIVSTNHYIKHNQKWIEVKDHPEAFDVDKWSGGSERPLICLNTDTHQIPINDYIFSDYDETEDCDIEAMLTAERILNAATVNRSIIIGDYSPSMYGETKIKMADGSVATIKDVKLGDRIANGGKIVGIVRKEIDEFVDISGDKVHPSTLVWHSNSWVRCATINKNIIRVPEVYYNLFVSSNSVIETQAGNCFRDYIEVMSPDMRVPYSKTLESA